MAEGLEAASAYHRSTWQQPQPEARPSSAGKSSGSGTGTAEDWLAAGSGSRRRSGNKAKLRGSAAAAARRARDDEEDAAGDSAMVEMQSDGEAEISCDHAPCGDEEWHGCAEKCVCERWTSATCCSTRLRTAVLHVCGHSSAAKCRRAAYRTPSTTPRSRSLSWGEDETRRAPRCEGGSGHPQGGLGGREVRDGGPQS